VAAGELEASAEEPQAVAGGLGGLGEERQVVHGDHQRRPGAGDGHRGGVHQVDGPGGLLHPGPTHAVPRLVEGEAGQAQVVHRDRRQPGGAGRLGVAGGDAHDLDVAPGVEGAGQGQDGGGAATGDAVPALFEGQGHAHVGR
jgi:hypothetical protein